MGHGPGAVEDMEINSWKNRSVLITGATGLVGCWLMHRLIAAGAQVTVLVQDVHGRSPFLDHVAHKDVHCFYGNLEDLTIVEKALLISGADTVFHLGAQTIVGNALSSPWITFESNVRGTYNLLEACRRQGKSVKAVVVASSDKAYGDSAQLPYTENMPLNGIAPYDASKVCTEVIARSYTQTYGLPVIVARCGNIYGGGDLNFSRLIPGTIKSLLFDQAPIIRSDGTFVRDYVYVKNVAEVYMKLAQLAHQGRSVGEAFNYSDDMPKTVIEIVTHITRLMGKEHLKPVIQNSVVHEIHDQHLSSAKLRGTVDCGQLSDLDAALTETIGWYREFFRK